MVSQRLAQLDAQDLDNELVFTLRQSLSQVSPKSKMDRFRAEITALLNLLVCRLPLYLDGASYGYQMQNMTCGKLLPFQILPHACFTVLFPYLQIKYPQWKSILGPKVEYQLQRLEFLWKTCSLLNLGAFLINGRYMTLLNRLLGIQLTLKDKYAYRMLYFDYRDRQLIWTAITDLLSIVIPMINPHKIKTQLSHILRKQPTMIVKKGQCAICVSMARKETSIQMAHHGLNCEHDYCYYCLATALEEDPNVTCLQCGKVLGSCIVSF